MTVSRVGQSALQKWWQEVAHQLRVMARNWQDSREGKTPLTDGLRGAVRLPRDFDQHTAVTEELQKKHDVQG
jgi:hypothetical protein